MGATSRMRIRVDHNILSLNNIRMVTVANPLYPLIVRFKTFGELPSDATREIPVTSMALKLILTKSSSSKISKATGRIRKLIPLPKIGEVKFQAPLRNAFTGLS
jgi:hypothetical protein